MRDFSISDKTVPAAHRGTYLAFTDDSDGTQAPAGARRAGPEHRAPAADVRHRLDRGGPGQAADTGLRPRLVRAGQRPAAGVRHGGRRHGRLQLGLRPAALDGARGLVRSTHDPDGGAAGRGVPHDGRRRCTTTGCGWCWTRSFNHTPASGPGADSRCSTGSCPATTSGSTPTGAVETSTCCQNIATEHAMAQKLMVDSVRAVGAQLQGRRLPLRPDGPPQQGEHAGRPRRAGHADAAQGRRGRRSRSTSTARAGTSARSANNALLRRRPPRASSAAPGSARSPTGSATPSAAAARSTTTRACRASAPACPPTRTATPINGDDGRAPARRTTPTWSSSGLAGNLRTTRSVDARGETVTGRRRSTTTARRPATPTSRTRSITYVDAHDNETLFDALTYKLPVATSMAGPGADEHGVAGDHRAGADAVVLARRRRPAAQQVAGPQQLRLAATGSTASTGPARTTVRPRAAARGATTRPSGLSCSRCWPTRRSSRRRPTCAAATAQAQDLLRLRFSHAAVPARLGAGRSRRRSRSRFGHGRRACRA